VCIFGSLSRIKWLQLCDFITGSSILFTLSSCLFLYQCHADFIIWHCSITKSDIVIPKELLFFAQDYFWNQDILLFHMKFGIWFGISVRNDVVILMDVLLNLQIAFGKYNYYHDINSANSWSWEIFSASGILLSFFLQVLLFLL
jgi:hypothetical protein